MKKTTRALSDQIRDAIDESGMSRYAICMAVGLSQSTMSRFMKRNGGLSVDVLDKIGDLLQLRVVSRANKSRKGN